MSKGGCLFYLIVAMGALIYFGFCYEFKPYYPNIPQETWKDYGLYVWTLENGKERVGTYSESNQGKSKTRGN